MRIRGGYGIGAPGRCARRGGERTVTSDPMESVGSLFDVAMLIGVGFMVMALSALGLSDFLSSDDLTVVTNPGQPDMEIVVKTGDKVERLSSTGELAQGSGQPIGTVYRLENGTVVWVPEGSELPPLGEDE